jgi:hypothetical protein
MGVPPSQAGAHVSRKIGVIERPTGEKVYQRPDGRWADPTGGRESALIFLPTVLVVFGVLGPTFSRWGAWPNFAAFLLAGFLVGTLALIGCAFLEDRVARIPPEGTRVQ